MNLFDWVNNITLHKKEFDSFTPEDQKSYNQYQINRFVSMAEVYVKTVNVINKYKDLPDSNHHNFFCEILPKRKQYFPYIKKSKDLLIDDRKILMEYFECGKKEVDTYINILGEDDIKKILELYKRK